MIVRPKVDAYAEDHSSPETTRLADLAEETRKVSEMPYMMVGPVEGHLLAMLVRMLAPSLVVEIGTFTGYSALAMAEALPPGGRLVSCEIDPANAEIAQRHIALSPWADRVEIRVGPALTTLADLPGPFDFVFVDADKTGYSDYYEAVLPKLSDRALLAVDNTLHLGQVVSDTDQSADTCAIRAFNEKVRDDPRVEQVVLTLRQGLTLIRRLPAPEGM
jgi:caffeoyl-CoA O-methyltransferase